MKGGNGLSEIRASIELILFFIGLIAGTLLIYILFFDFSKSPDNYLSLIKAKEVFASLLIFNFHSIYIYILALTFLFLTIRFILLYRKTRNINTSS